MEKKNPTPQSHLELLIPNKKQSKKTETHSAFTEEELVRNEAWHGVKKEEVKSRATVHSLEEARKKRDEKSKSEEQVVIAGALKMSKKTEEDIQKEIAMINADLSLNTLEKNKRLRALDRETEALERGETVEGKPEEKKMTAAELREARAEEEKRIEKIAQHLFEQRMQGVDAEGIDQILVEKNIKPWTPEAQEFMEKYDWAMAEQIFKQLTQQREEAVVKANESEQTKRIELQEYQGKYVDEKFSAFGINPDALPEGLRKEFETLTYGQRLLVAENLQQLTLGRVQEEAAQKFYEDTKQAKFLGRIWKGITKKYQIAKHEQATATGIKTGGLEYHGELLKQLVEGTKRTGLDAIEGKDGILELQYVEAHPLMTERQKEETKEFNRTATLYSKTPYEWSLATATSAQKKEYERMHAQFEKAKEHILKTEQSIIGDEDSLLFVADIENKIRLNQFFNTHPDAEKQLQSIENDTVWQKAIANTVTERGMYFGAGLATRTFATGLLGAVGFPIAAVGMGGWMARRRAAETLREREKGARLGSKDVLADARAAKDVNMLLQRIGEKEQAISEEVDDIKKAALAKEKDTLRTRLEALQEKHPSLRKGVKDIHLGSLDVVAAYGRTEQAIPDVAHGLTEKLDRLVQRINSEENEAKKAELLASLQVRLEYTKNKLDKGAVDFGSADRRIANQYALMDALTTGSSTLAVMDAVEGRMPKRFEKDTRDRLDQFLQFKDEKISKAQKDYLRKQMIYGAGLGIAAFSAGYYAKEVLHGTGPVETHAETVGARETAPEVKAPSAAPEQAKEAAAVVRGHRPKVDMPKAVPVSEEVVAEPKIVEETLPLNKQPIDVDKAFREQPVEGMTSPVPHVEKPTIALETIIENQFGLDSEEYNAIKGVKVETLLKQIPSRDEAWAIWRGEVPGSEITLPHDGIYGAMEFKKHIDLAEHIRELHPDDTAMKGDVDAFMKGELKGKFRLSEMPTGGEHVTPSVSEATPASVAVDAEDVPTGQQIMGEAPRIEGLVPEKIALLNDDIYNSKMPVQKIITQYKVGNITPEDFANYYAEKVAHAKPSADMLKNVKNTFSQAAGEGTPQQRITSQEAIKAMVQRMQGIK